MLYKSSFKYTLENEDKGIRFFIGVLVKITL